MNVALVQTDPVFGEKRSNIRQALSLMGSVKADLYVLPELFASGYNFHDRDEVARSAESFADGETSAAMRAFAEKNGCWIVYGFPESANGVFYNSAGMVGGGISGVYRKVHLFDREKLFFAPGDMGFQVYSTPHGSIGVMVCFDWYFPESMRTLTLKGAQLIAHPSNLVLPHCPDSMPVRCRENRVFAATANRVGTEDRGGHALTYIGQSQITSPRGDVLHRCSRDRAEVAVHNVDLKLADNKNLNERNHLLEDRRPEFYQ